MLIDMQLDNLSLTANARGKQEQDPTADGGDRALFHVSGRLSIQEVKLMSGLIVSGILCRTRHIFTVWIWLSSRHLHDK